MGKEQKKRRGELLDTETESANEALVERQNVIAENSVLIASGFGRFHLRLDVKTRVLYFFPPAGK